jgi:Transposase DDE domain
LSESRFINLIYPFRFAKGKKETKLGLINCYTCPSSSVYFAGLTGLQSRGTGKKGFDLYERHLLVSSSRLGVRQSGRADGRTGRYKYLAIHIHESVRQRARELTPEFAKAQRQRKKVEALFAELKNQIGLRRLRLRRMKFVREQFWLAATVQNIKRQVRFLSRPAARLPVRTLEPERNPQVPIPRRNRAVRSRTFSSPTGCYVNQASLTCGTIV